MKKTVNVYIHGANSSSRSFEFMKKNITGYDSYSVEYSSNVALDKNISTIHQDLADKFQNRKINLIGHSMGGIIAVELYNRGLDVNKIVTLSTPFGGSKIADFFQWFYPACHIFTDMAQNSKIIKSMKRTHIQVPMISIVTHKGHIPVFGEANDGTVTVKSQTILSGTNYIFMDLNHFEVLLDDQALNVVEQFLA